MLEAIPADVRACSRVLVETNDWFVGSPKAPLATRARSSKNLLSICILCPFPAPRPGS